MQSLKSRHGLLESEKGSAALYEIQKLREELNAMREEQSQRATDENRDKHEKRVARIKERLRAPDYQTDQELSMEDRNEKNSGSWIFRDPRFRAWSDDNTPNNCILYVNGIPGAGTF